ncbi:protein Wnt-8a [Lutzomyia longipalpis]|uniref:protein Wnt-8a n=1 Tax=Lutzomyia longipalpis TaxID=7200 RepID=UPI002483723E|nr:protein Wnt-8a [Lutzomyia longipalpis]
MDRLSYFIIIFVISAFVCPTSSLNVIHQVNRTPLEVKFKNSITRFNPLAEIVRNSEKLALRNCKEIFRWDQWNCPTGDFLQKRTSNILDKEGAFVKALSAAAVIYSSITNCSGNFMECDCKFNVPVEDESQIVKCVDHIISLENLLVGNDNSVNIDTQGYAQLHNSRAGRIAVQRALKHQCKCSGYTSACSIQTCWMLISSFPEITSDIRKMYDHGVKVAIDNSGRVKRNIKREALVYLDNSPNYCVENVIHEWPGMLGRQCSRRRTAESSLHERRSCRKLCRACGLKVKRERVVKEKPCKCKFYWCCDVQCEKCSELVNEFYCH